MTTLDDLDPGEYALWELERTISRLEHLDALPEADELEKLGRRLVDLAQEARLRE